LVRFSLMRSPTAYHSKRFLKTMRTRTSEAGGRLKVMQLIDGMGIGGAEMVVRDLVHHLDRDRFDVSVCCTKGVGGPIGEALLSEGVNLFVLSKKQDGGADYFEPFKLRRAAMERGVDVIHSHGTAALFAAGPCRVMTPRVKLVHTLHYGNYPYTSGRTHFMEKLCLRFADEVIAVGREQRRQVQATYALPDSQIEVIWNGIKPLIPKPDPTFRSRVGAEDRVLVGTIAKLIEQKGLEDLLAVARRCMDAGHRMKFVIVGDGPLRADLERRRRELGVEDAVTITGWIHEAATRVLPSFDVFFQPSRWEAMSIAVLEAMACGKAIVATKVGDNPHVLQHGVSGLLVESGDTHSMTSALEQLTDAKVRADFGQGALARFTDRFTVEQMIQQYERVYESISGRA
jgi:glycosyltransferase involved in cell wall biosynthesis